MLLLGCLAFLLFFLSDLNDVRLRRKPLTICFPMGAIMLATATVVSCLANSSPYPRIIKMISLVFGSICFVLLIMALFFSVSAEDAYIKREEGRPVSTNGLYSLCRHPGVLFFIPTYICISVAFGLPFLDTGVYSLLDLLLIVYEDVHVFPKVLSNYSEYKTHTPFLIPNKSGIKKLLVSLKSKR